MIQLIKDHRYLVRQIKTDLFTYDSGIREWKILEISKTSIKFQKHQAGVYFTETNFWKAKEDFEKEYEIIEDLDTTHDGYDTVGIELPTHHWLINGRDYYSYGPNFSYQYRDLVGNNQEITIKLIK
jgi:hypothetical protein